MQSIFRNYIQEKRDLNNKSIKPNHKRSNIKPGLLVYIVLKEHQKQGILTKGIVKDILTSKPTHTQGIKVRLESGQVGRVQCIIGQQKCNFKKDGNVILLNEEINSISGIDLSDVASSDNSFAIWIIKLLLSVGVGGFVTYKLLNIANEVNKRYSIKFKQLYALSLMYHDVWPFNKNIIQEKTRLVYDEYVSNVYNDYIKLFNEYMQ